jgi:TPR repeat protein
LNLRAGAGDQLALVGRTRQNTMPIPLSRDAPSPAYEPILHPVTPMPDVITKASLVLLLPFAVIGTAAPIVHASDAMTRTSSIEEQSASPLVAPILTFRAQERSPERDRKLYDAAVALFHAIEKSTEPPSRRDLMAKALYEVARGGHANAWIDYGRCLWNGWGVLEDHDEALAAYKRAADLGSDYGAYVTAYNLYWHFKNYDEAHAFALKALKGQDPNGDVRYLLGLMAYNGRGRAKDMQASLRLHQEAAERGNADAFFELFVYAASGVGEKEKATYYLKEAAKRDQPRAAANLGALYATGQMQGVDRDLAQSVMWYKRAADLGVGRAAAALAVMALRGEGMAKDPEATKTYLRRADELHFDVDEFLQANQLRRP